jgi:hypothetical protein
MRRGVMPLAVLVAVMSVVFIGGAAWLYDVQKHGERSTATVTDCTNRRTYKSTNIHCTGSWVKGGSLLEGGRVVLGTIDGANSGDIGKKIDVRLRGDRAYVESLRLPIILLVIGLLFAGFGGREVYKQMRAEGPSIPGA